MPQSVEPTATNPHPQPRIVIEKLPLEQNIPYIALTRVPRDTGCACRVLLAIPGVDMDDTSVELTARYFIDYDVRDVRRQVLRGDDRLPAPADISQVHRAGPTFSPSADDLGADGFHTVDVVIADSNAWVETNGVAASDLPFKSVKKDYASTAYRWLVLVTTDPNAAKCVDDGKLFKGCASAGN